MKKIKRLPLLCLFALVILSGVLAFGTNRTASAAQTTTYISNYDITYDISSNRAMSICEDITVSYHGNAGFFRYIPTNGGELIRNVKVSKLVDGTPQSVYYDVSDYDDGFVEIELDDYVVKYTPTTYRITYDYNLTKAQEGENLLALTPISADIPCMVEDINLTFILPDGYVSGSADCFINKYSGQEQIKVTQSQKDGRVQLSASIDYIPKYTEIRIDLGFEAGALSTYSDFTPYWFVLAGAAIIALIWVVKLLFFNKSYLTPIVNYEAPDKMDPLIMGKLIDNKVNSEDVTSLIYYWANKGYLAINLDDKDDPILIRKIMVLPESAQDYEQVMFYNLFKNGDAVRVSSLKNSFYKIVDKVTAMVNGRAKKLYDSKSFALNVLFSLVGCLLLGLAPLIIGMTQISFKFLYITAFISIVPGLILNAAMETLMYYRLKLSKGKIIGFGIVIAILCVLCSLLYTVFVPSYIMGFVPKFILGLIVCVIIGSSVLLICRTKEYTAKLNDVVGFRNFIQLAEKDRLEMLLEENPQFYYYILPYAQVLGVTDKWQEKFEDLTVVPPSWATGSMVHTYLEFRIINSLIRGSMLKMASGMASRPSSSGYSGGGHGGFGGHFGGGHGGGGIRFK